MNVVLLLHRFGGFSGASQAFIRIDQRLPSVRISSYSDALPSSSFQVCVLMSHWTFPGNPAGSVCDIYLNKSSLEHTSSWTHIKMQHINQLYTSDSPQTILNIYFPFDFFSCCSVNLFSQLKT